MLRLARQTTTSFVATKTMMTTRIPLVRPLRKLEPRSLVSENAPIESLDEQQRFLSIVRKTVSESQATTTTTYPPRIQSWLDCKSPIELSIKPEKSKRDLLIHREETLDKITKQDPAWLEQVVKEIRHDVLVGTMTPPVRNLCHTLMRWLQTQGYMAQIVEDLLIRLLEEEDYSPHGGAQPVNGVLFSIAMDAWAKQSSISRDAPQRAEALLQLMQDRYKENPSRRARPRPSHVSQVLVAWSNSTCSHAPQRAQQLLEWMEDSRNKFPPSVHAYTSVIHAYSRHGKVHDAERILRLMEARVHDNPDTAVRPNVKTYTAVIGAWAHAGQGERGAHMAERVLQRLNDLYQELQDQQLKPNVKLLTTLMQAWAKSESPKQGEKADELWNEIVELHANLSEEERKDPSNEINIIPYNVRMEAWSKCLEPERAEAILNEMLDRVAAGDKNAVVPSATSWSVVAHGWGRKGNVKRTEDVLKRLHEQACAGKTTVTRNVVMYNALLLAWRRSKDTHAANKAQRLLDWMEEQADSGMEELRPNELSYDLVITKWRTSRQYERAAKNSLELLGRMEDYLKTHPISIKSSIGSAYAMALSTVAREGKADSHLKVLELLRRMETIHKAGSMGPVLTNHSYHIALAACAWAPARDGEQLAEDIFRRMEASTQREFLPRRRSYEAAIAAWARSFKDEAPVRAHAILKSLEKRAEKEPDIAYEPSCKTYNYVLGACVASRAPEATEIAQEVLKTMMEKRRAGDKEIRPRRAIFKVLFGDRFDHREDISAKPIEDMIHQIENSSGNESVDEQFLFDCYLYALTVWGWTIDADAVLRAEQLWERMNESSYVSPNLECFNSLLRAYTNDFEGESSGHVSPHKVDELLRKVELDFSSGSIDWRPDSESYDCAIEIWAKSKEKGAPENAFLLLKRMDTIYKKFGSDYVKPSVATYGMVLLACALTPATDDATRLHHFNIAVRSFNHLRDSDYCEPDGSLYNRLLMCAIFLAPDRDTRVKMTRHIFSLCCRTGHVDKRILKHFWKVTPKEERKNLLGRDDNDVKVSDLPPEWIRNASSKLSQA